MCLVADYLERSANAAQDTNPRRVVAHRVVQGFQMRAAGATYGEISMYPDYVGVSNDLLHTSQQGLWRIDSRAIREHPFLIGIGEVRRNSHHFRLEAFEEFHSLHDDAVVRAWAASLTIDPQEQEDALVDAIALNAFADHFLEDALAPGHMTDDAHGRSHMQNDRAHDLGNSEGRTFRVPGDVLAELVQMAGESLDVRRRTYDRCFPIVVIASPRSGGAMEAAKNKRCRRPKYG